MSRLFISHASADRGFVDSELMGLFRALGFDPWCAESDIQSSEQWERMILGALRSSKWFVLVMSPRASASEWVKDEVAWAVEELGDNIIPILIENCDPRDIHIRLPRIQQLDFRVRSNPAREQMIRLLVDREYKPLVRERGVLDVHQRRLHAFWQPLVEGGLQVVLGRFREFSNFEQSGMLGVGDVTAMTELVAALESVGLNAPTISYADRLDGDALRTNLVALGGPDVNVLSREVTRHLSATLTIGYLHVNNIALYDTQTHDEFIPDRRDPSHPANDYGILYNCRSPFAENKRLILAAGSYGYGTWACTRFLLSDQFLTHPLVVEHESVEFLIENAVLWEAPQRISVRVARPLSDE